MNKSNNMELKSATSKRTVRSPAPARPDLLGKRYANLLRCSNLTAADTSPEGQKQINDGFCSLNGMQWVADVYAEGVSGSQTFNRQDFQEVLEEHRKHPFDVVVVHDLSRLTRGGIRHGNVVEDMFRKAGLKVVSSTDFIPDGPEGDLVKSIKHYANQLQARSISLAVARGLSQSLAKNSRPAAGRNPYGLDREYLGPDGSSRILVRWDGRTQLWLKPGTEELVGKRNRPPKVTEEERKQQKRKRGRIFKGYAKQADETSKLVRGSKNRHDVLVWMFMAYDVWKWGYHRIAQHLNEVMRVPSPDGDQWVMKSVKSILFNAIYLGLEVRHRWTGSLYNMVTQHGTVAVQVDQDELEKEKRTAVPHTERPREDWRLVDVPGLKDVLPSPLREITAERIMRQFDTSIPPHPKKGKALHTGEGRHKQLNSPFLLTNVLHSKQTGHSMRGEICDKKLLNRRKQYRYYFDGGAAIRAKKGLHIRRIPAVPVEEAVVGVVQRVLTDSASVEERVKATVSELVDQQPGDGQRRNTLLAERTSISTRLLQAYKLLGSDLGEAIETEIAKDRTRFEAIAKELNSLDRVDRPEQIDVGQVTKNILQRLRGLDQQFGGLPNAEMKQVLRAMVNDLTIDLSTGAMTFDVALPDWMKAPSTPETGDLEVRLDSPLPWPWVVDANRNSPRLLLSQWSCQLVKKQCYECSRRAA